MNPRLAAERRKLIEEACGMRLDGPALWERAQAEAAASSRLSDSPLNVMRRLLRDAATLDGGEAPCREDGEPPATGPAVETVLPLPAVPLAHCPECRVYVGGSLAVHTQLAHRERVPTALELAERKRREAMKGGKAKAKRKAGVR